MPEFFDRLAVFRQGTTLSRQSLRQIARWRLHDPVIQERLGLVGKADLITVDEKTEKTFLDLMAQTAPAVTEAFNQHFTPMAQSAFDRWPVDTGVSKALMRLAYMPGGSDTFVGSLRNLAPYAHLIYRKAKKKDQRKFADLPREAQENILRAADRKRNVRKRERRKKGIAPRRNHGEVARALIWQPGDDAADAIATYIANHAGGRP